jgi:uncharacterized membrane protein YecN with MAPEG domain
MTYGIKAPATFGNENFERYYRVQMNTLELLICFIPALVISSLFWSPLVMSIIGLIFFIGRIIYFKQYVANPEKRTVGFALSIMPVFILLFATIVGIIRSIL